MIASKHITKIVAVVVAVAALMCFAAMAYSEELTEALGGTGVAEEYEAKLFDTAEIMSVDISMDEDLWREMLDNAMSEVYYECDVTINGTTFYSVGIRPKGNTSLSSIASDPDNDRYSFKLEFDQYVDGQTCYGLDKLVLNNNFADATNMKEAVIYDMFSYLGADASLYNYAKISVNGSYYGVYLALEGVEESFMLRNNGVESGELYKPESMGVGGGGGGKNAAAPDTSKLPEDFDASSIPGGFGGGDMPEGFDPSNIPEGFGGGEMPEGFDASDIPEGAGFAAPSQSGDASEDSESGESGENRSFDGKMSGGFSMSGGGADLNYTDDDLDSYSTIWEGSVTDTTDADHRRVVESLKHASEGTELETYLDVDNILKYMAVHSFAVNDDSLSGSMAHNYYLYEYDGKLNILPWDYNLSFGGMGMRGRGTDSGASAVINDPIDTPFSGTDFFDSLLENEEYLARYHEYYQKLVEEYVLGGGFDETYERIRSQIDGLVETDPNAMYTYEEYCEAADMLYSVVALRAKSVQGQLDGTIPSTSSAQSAEPEALIDASSIDIEAMGVFAGGGFDTSDDESESTSQDVDAPSDDRAASNAEDAASSRRSPGGFGGGGGKNSGGEAPTVSSNADAATLENVLWIAGMLALLALAILTVKLYRRKPHE